MSNTTRTTTPEATDLLRISAGALYPVSGPALIDGAILIAADGRIAAVGPEASVPRPESAETVRFSDAVVLPGLVNAHTHLELTALGGAVEDRGFFAWLQHIRRAKAELSEEAFLESAQQGVRDAWRCGITTVADTGDSGAVVCALTDLGGRGVVYHEVFGPHPAQADEAFASLEQAVERLLAVAGSTVRVGVSPHAPYTVSGRLYRRVSEFAREAHLPIAVHIAESPAETALVTRGRGPFATAWRWRGIPAFDAARSPVAYLDSLGVLAAHPLAIHAVHTDRADARLLVEHGCSVALCPRSNARHGHGVPPVALLVDAGVTVGVGTDSVASVASLDLFADLRCVCDMGGLSAAHGLELATCGGARAIGLGDEVGSLEQGKWGDLCVLRQPDGRTTDKAGLAQQILRSGCEDVLATYVAGRRVYAAENHRHDEVRKRADTTLRRP